MRYQPDRTLPVYAYLPGRDPHPTRDPKGHSFGTQEPAFGYLAPERWAENDEYLWGVDLYNHGYLWESHEAWEGLWHVAKAEDDRLQGLHLQGLIQCAAAWLKIPMGQPRGLERLSQLGRTKLSEVAETEGPLYMGLDLGAYIDAVEAYAASGPDSFDKRPRIQLER